MTAMHEMDQKRGWRITDAESAVGNIHERRAQRMVARRFGPAGCQPESYPPERVDKSPTWNRPGQRRRGSKSTLKEVVRSFEAFQSCLK